MKKNKGSFLTILVAVILAAALSSAVTAFFLLDGFGGTGSTLQKYARLETIRKIVEKEYYLETDTDTLMNGALEGMLESLDDPYTYYITPEEAQARTKSETQSYYGLGMTVQMSEEDQLTVVLVSEGTPAEKSGIHAGDIITSINNTDIAGMSLEDAVALIQSNDASDITLAILRDGCKSQLTVTREEISVSNVRSLVLDDTIGYISITQFAGNDVEDFKAALDDLRAKNISGLIVDLRDNPGGYLDHVTEIADMLLPEALIVYTQDRSGKRIDHYSDAEYYDVPLCVLVNGNSASASEIFTAAMKDNERGTVIGTQTFGKGIVQTVYTFEDDGAAIQFTSATYYTPNGVCIHGTGITPDIIEEDENAQLDKALEVLNNASTEA